MLLRQKRVSSHLLEAANQLVPCKTPLGSADVFLLGPLLKLKSCNRFILPFVDRFNNLTQAIQLQRTTVLDVTKAFDQNKVFRYGFWRSVLSDNCTPTAGKLYQNTCTILGIFNTCTFANHAHTNCPVERFIILFASMLSCYVFIEPENWDEYADTLTYSYSIIV